MEKDKLSDSMIETIIKNDKSIDLIIDITDFSIEHVLESPIKELPVIKYFVGIVKLGISIRDKFLIKKILIFLRELQKIEKKEREKFKEKIKSDKNYSNKIGEQLIFILDRYDHMTKAEILAKLFIGYIDEKITYEEFLRLSISIERTFINDLNRLHLYYKRNLEEVDDLILQNLYQSGLVSMSFNKIATMVVDQPDIESITYVRNKLGHLFCKIVADYPMDESFFIPTLNDLENKIFESVCKEEDTNQDYNDFDKLRHKLETSFKLSIEQLDSIFSKFEKLGLIGKTKQNMMGNYVSFHTSFKGYDYYFQEFHNRSGLFSQVIKALREDELKESSTFSREKNISQRIVDHCLSLLQIKGIIFIKEHSSGFLVNNINKSELIKFND